MFMAKPYQFHDGVATMLAQMCCHDNQLPQGAPTSPLVSNMICARLDGELQRLGARIGWAYTRYADDLTFSTHQSALNDALVSFEGKVDIRNALVGSQLEAIVMANGFVVNKRKVRLMRFSAHQEVTGLTVNSYPNIRRRFMRQVRAMIHAQKKYGLDLASREHNTRYRLSDAKGGAGP